MICGFCLAKEEEYSTITNLFFSCRTLFVVFVVAVDHKDTQCYISEPKMQENQEKATSEKAQEHKKI